MKKMSWYAVATIGTAASLVVLSPVSAPAEIAAPAVSTSATSGTTTELAPTRADSPVTNKPGLKPRIWEW